ncbi:alpha/beta fold hydrolase [Pontibacter cellulosilyticus]|uniref:Alpha/beta hydrolase n=1 Tax=Pontibacter cellulosilyticus TaxID=1720253 RepID=A0A923SHT5_9BACT|nr:alpha/beta hydrolase [Pontibacter cellulosilyticus]MBC5992033.1 alpha/beta hydrolase [Pontibacter cellulosilyticus]
MSTSEDVARVISQHEATGKYINVNGIRTFVADTGTGEAVFCIHGVPTSSFLYRKMLRALAGKSYRGICVDLPGLGLSQRPEDFDYSFHNFARFLNDAANVLGLEKFHLVVHDIGGPIGFALAAENKEKILSLTILNTWIEVDKFEKPLPMRPFEKPVLGEAELAGLVHQTWHLMFKALGVVDSSNIPNEEIYAYVDLLKREDKGKAFLKIMRNFDKSEAFKNLCMQAVQHTDYPVQAIWGADDPGLKFERYGTEIMAAAGLKDVCKLRARHLLQEEKWQEIADKTEELILQTKHS